MLSRKSSLRLPKRLGFLRDKRGATAVEFAIIAMPFLGLMAGIVELGFLFMVSVSLDNGLQAASRRIRTGELQNPSTATPAQTETNRQSFRDEVCDGMGFMSADCKTKLSIDVHTVNSFSEIALTNPVSGGVFNPGAQGFSTGGAGSYVIVTAYYRWTMFMPLMNQALQRMSGETLLTSVTTFRNEPFG